MSSGPTEKAVSVNSSSTLAFRWENTSYLNMWLTPLDSYTSYRFTVSTAAKDAQGDNMANKYSWTFTVGRVSVATPLKWVHAVSGLGTGESSPIIADVASDPGEEVIYVGGDTGAASGAVLCLAGTDGHEIWRYTDVSIGWNVQPQMGDIDKDGQMEIVVPCYSPTGVICLNTDNTKTGSDAVSLYWKRTGIGGSSYTSKPLLVDPEGDGYWMVVCAAEDVRGYSNDNTYTGRIWTFNYDGREMNNGLWGTPGGIRSATNGYNAPLGFGLYQWFGWRPCSGGFSMADTDNNGLFELFQNDRDMYYGDGDFGKGTICWEWNTTTQSLQLKWYQPDMLVSSHAPVLVDTTNDGVLEVVVAHQRGGLAVFNSTTGAEIKKDYEIGLPSHYQPVVYDVDHDGNPEILLADGDHPTNSPADIVVFDLTTWQIDARMAVGPCKFPPTVGEVTGDGIMDIIAVSDTGIFIFDGATYDGALKTFTGLIQVATGLPYQCMYAVVQDIDYDGRTEIVVTSSGYRVYAFDTPGLAPALRARSEVQYYNERRTGVAEYVPPVFYDRKVPIVSEEHPFSASADVPANIGSLSFKLNDLQNDLMNYFVTTDLPVDPADLTGQNKPNGVYSVDVTGALQYNHRYTWSVCVTDGVNWNNKTYTFTTVDGAAKGNPPTQSAPLLTSSGVGDFENSTSVSLVCTPQSTTDQDGDILTNIFNWQRNGKSIANLIMPFDTNSLATAKDYSGYNNNGQVYGATWTSNGKVGGCYSFDGVDDYLKISDGGAGYYNGRIYPSSLGGTGDWSELTVEMWINLAEESTKESTRLLMKIPSYEIGLGAIGGLSPTKTATTVTAGVWLDNPTSGDNAGPPNTNPKATEYWCVSAPATSAIMANTWYHVAFTYRDGGGASNSELILYINGVAVASATSQTTYGSIKASSGEPLFIGWYDYFKGLVDDLSIYSRALSAEQISQHYNETCDGLTSSSTLTELETRVGETWTCRVTPNDSQQDGITIASNALTVLSGPQLAPVASNVQVWGDTSLSNVLVWSNEPIRAVYDYYDANDDPEVLSGPFCTQIQWFKNGTYQPELDNMRVLDESLTTAHEDWTYRVKPGDGHGLAADWVDSSNKVIVNSPPVVDTYYPVYGPTMSSITMYVGTSQTFNFTYSDMDGDPVFIQWQLIQWPDMGGQMLPEYGTSYTWTAPETGIFGVAAIIMDSGYGATSTYLYWVIYVR